METSEEYTPFLAARVDDPFPSATILGCPYEDPRSFRKGAAEYGDLQSG